MCALRSPAIRAVCLTALMGLSACAADVPPVDECKHRNGMLIADAPARIYVFFASGQATINSKDLPHIEKRVREFQELGATEIRLAGHSDLVGTADNNMRLSLARARAVARHIESLKTGIRIAEIKGFGETQPLVPTRQDTPEPQNRRVEVRARGHQAFTSTVDKCGNKIVIHRP